MYSQETQIMLLDDPLSAVDAHVGEHLFKEAITGAVSRGTTRVLVTHHVHFLPRCDAVIILEKGRISHMGKYADLVAKGVDFKGAVEVEKKETADGEAEEGEEVKDAAESTDKPAAGDGKESTAADAKMKKAGEKLISDEEKEEGSVQGSNYKHYARAGGVIAFVSIFVIQGIGRASELMANFWLSFWANASTQADIAGDRLTAQETTWYLGIYAAFGLGGVICLTFRAVIMAVHRLKASRKLHDELIESILRAPVSFFDVTPIGRVLNRFAADMDKIDLELTNSLGQAVSTIFSFLGAVGAIVAATKGTLLVAFVPIGYANFVIQKWFRKSFTEIQRAANVANSPIFTDFSQMLSGTSTIRAFGKETRFFKNCQLSFDKFNALYNALQQCGFWLGLRLDVLGGTVGLVIGAVALGTKDANFIPAGWLGLALSYSIEVTAYLKHGVRMIATVEADMNSVERVLYYTNNVEPEAALTTESDPNIEEWPSKGQIEIQHASMRYRDGPLVLKDLCVSIKGGEKIGVVGRTGSGELIVWLFCVSEQHQSHILSLLLIRQIESHVSFISHYRSRSRWGKDSH
jgi:ABC-type multidrug transport system fused ATPase/permease subunit